MPPLPPRLDLAELSELADVSVRTIRYYIQQGLLSSPETRGPGAHYDAEHLARLRLIKRLQREHLPLAEIRKQLEGMSASEIERLAEAESDDRVEGSAADYILGVLSEGSARLFAAPDNTRVAHSRPPGIAHMGKGAGGGAGKTRSQWDRIVLDTDVELHVRRPLSRMQNKQVERLLEAARNIFGEDAT
jgi:DNA-binding transcriptional MerR regulator